MKSLLFSVLIPLFTTGAVASGYADGFAVQKRDAGINFAKTPPVTVKGNGIWKRCQILTMEMLTDGSFLRRRQAILHSRVRLSAR